MPTVQQLSLFMKNEPGILSEVCQTLASRNINIRAMSISDTVDHAVVRLIVDDPDQAVHLLGERGVLVVETELLALELSNRPGTLAEAVQKLAEAGINVEYAYGSGAGDQCVVMIRVLDVNRAMAVLDARNSQ